MHICLQSHFISSDLWYIFNFRRNQSSVVFRKCCYSCSLEYYSRLETGYIKGTVDKISKCSFWLNFIYQVKIDC